MIFMIIEFRRAAEKTKQRKHREWKDTKVQEGIEPLRRVSALLKGLIRR